MAEFMGWQKYLQMEKESTWGTKPASADLFVPYTTFDVGTKVQSQQADLFNGGRQRKHNRIVKATVDGQLVMPLWAHHLSSKSIAQHLIEWATSGPASANLDSWSLDRYEAGVDNKRFLGSRVNSMTLAGDAESGNITITLNIFAKQESGGVSVTAAPASAAQPIDFVFSDVDFYLSSESEGQSASSSSEAVSIRSFQLTINNNLQVYHVDDYWPGVIPAGVRTVDFQFSLFNSANTYDALRRTSAVTNRAGHLRLKGSHGGTGASGTQTEIDFYFDKLNFANAADQAALNELSTQTVDWIALKPSTSNNELDISYSLV